MSYIYLYSECVCKHLSFVIADYAMNVDYIKIDNRHCARKCLTEECHLKPVYTSYAAARKACSLSDDCQAVEDLWCDGDEYYRCPQDHIIMDSRDTVLEGTCVYIKSKYL